MNYKTISNDLKIINTYQAIEAYELKTNGMAYHNYQHVLNVSNLVETLLIALNQDTKLIEAGKIAAILHDIGSTNGKFQHALLSYEYALTYLDKDLPYYDEILLAIKEHSDGFNTDNLLSLVLILSDKLDITKSRLAPYGYELVGIRQLQYLNSIDLEIINNTLIISFKSESSLDLKELEQFYFINKVFKAIRAFSLKFNLNYQVTLNNQLWNYHIIE